jgi:hypothetical protein
MESRLKKLNTSKVRKVYCIMMKLKKTSLSKNKIISKLLQPLQKKYRMEKEDEYDGWQPGRASIVDGKIQYKKCEKCKKKILNGKYVGPCRFNNEETCNKWTTDTSFKSDTLANIKSNKIKELEKEIANKHLQLSRDKKNKNLIAEILKLKKEKEWYEGDQILSGLVQDLKTRGGKIRTGPSKVDQYFTKEEIKSLMKYGDERNKKDFEQKSKAYDKLENIKKKKNDLKSLPYLAAPPLRRSTNILPHLIHGSNTQPDILGMENYRDRIPAQLITNPRERHDDHKRIYELNLPVKPPASIRYRERPYDKIRISYDPNTGEYTRIDSSSYFKKSDYDEHPDGFLI